MTSMWTSSLRLSASARQGRKILVLALMGGLVMEEPLDESDEAGQGDGEVVGGKPAVVK